MKNANKLLLIIILLFTLSCKSENIVMSAVKDGNKIDNGASINFELMQNYPNPFNPSTNIEFHIIKQMNLKMSVYTEDWELVKVLFDENKKPSFYSISFDATKDDGNEMPSGNYYYTLEGEGVTLTRTMKLLK